MQKIIIFDPLTAADVKKRLEEFQSVKNYLNAVMLTAARMNGASPDSVVDFTPDGAGVVITTPDAPEAEAEPSEGAAEPANMPGVLTAEEAAKKMKDVSKVMSKSGFNADDLNRK